jgi:hypothetical protein
MEALMIRSRIILTLAISMLFLSACSKKTEIPTAKGETPKVTLPDTKDTTTTDTQSGSPLALSCAASLGSSSTVVSGQSTSVTVTAAGGSAPYKLENYGGSFSATKTVSKVYTSPISSPITMTDTFQVIDSEGHNTQCELALTIVPPGTVPSDLACQVSASPSSPHVNELFDVTVSASGGTGIYTLGNISLGADGAWTSAVVPVNSSEARGTAKYTVAAIKTIQASVSDSAGANVICSRSVTVRPVVSLTLSASPSTSVNVGSTITVTPTATGFLAPVNFQFTHNETGISMVTSGTSVIFSSSNGLAHNYFTVTVTATSGNDTATSTIQIRFTSPATLSCSLTRTGSLSVNQVNEFKVMATSGEALEITEFLPDSGASITAASSSTRSVKYASIGNKNVYVRARSISTGLACNGGSYLVSSFAISSVPISCSAYTSPSSSLKGNWLIAGTNVLGGTSPVKLWSVCTIGQCFYPDTDLLAMYLQFNVTGTQHLTMTVYDGAGYTATCSTDHIVY